jgi:hypothetical protein
MWLDVPGTQLHGLFEHAGFIKVIGHLETKEKMRSWRQDSEEKLDGTG